MLWLAGLLGIAGVGAASFMVIDTPQETDEDEDLLADEPLPVSDGFLSFEHSESPSGSETANARDALAGTHHAGLLDDDDFDPSQDEDVSPVATGHALLNSIVDDPFDDSLAGLGGDDGGYELDEGTKFMLGDWISQSTGPEIIDYEAKKDCIVLVWDDTSALVQEPDVSVAPDPDDPEVMQVQMNGSTVAEVYGDCELSVSDLTLIPLSSALVVGLHPA
jgi:hypothetical protein